MLKKAVILFNDNHSEEVYISESELDLYLQNNPNIVSIYLPDNEDTDLLKKRFEKFEVYEDRDGIHIKTKEEKQWLFFKKLMK